jgi:hypothetical protein
MLSPVVSIQVKKGSMCAGRCYAIDGTAQLKSS